MKKIITSVLLLVCCVFCFTACGSVLGEEYWLETSTVLTEYFETENYKKVSNITFNSNITALMGESYGVEYAELTNLYAPLFNAGIFCAEKFANVLTVTPVNKGGNFQNKIEQAYQNLQNFKTQVNEFLSAKAVYEARIDFTDEQNATSAIEKSRLVKFKIEYIDLIESAYTLSNSLYDAYTIGYYNFSDFKNIEEADFSADEIEINRRLALNGSNLKLVDSAIRVLKIYNAKEIYNDYNNYWQISKRFFEEVVKYAYENTLDSSSSLLAKFATWKGVYDEFVQDTNAFANVVSTLQLDLLKKHNNDTYEYAKATGNPQDESNANFFLNYYKNVNLLFDYTKALV